MKKGIINVERTIHFYEMIPSEDTTDKTNISSSDFVVNGFRSAIQLNKSGDKKRFLLSYEALVCTRDISFKPEEKRISGKILKIRMDKFPELIDTENDIIKDIEASEKDGILEVTHFMIDYNNTPIIAIEYNQYGAKANDVYRYLNFVSQGKYKIAGIPIVRDTLRSFSRRIQRCSQFIVKVHKDEIDRVEDLDKGLFTALDAASDYGNSEYIALDLKFDYKSSAATQKIKTSIKNLIAKFLYKKEYKSYFSELSVRAEDSDRNHKIELFDMLSDKVKSRVSVEQRERSRAIVSADIFKQLNIEYDAKIGN